MSLTPRPGQTRKPGQPSVRLLSLPPQNEWPLAMLGIRLRTVTCGGQVSHAPGPPTDADRLDLCPDPHRHDPRVRCQRPAPALDPGRTPLLP
jgi:hypothetical protein